MQDLKVTILQSPLFWENKEKNIEMFSEKIQRIKNPTDLIVLPEMFTTGFSMNPEKFAEETHSNTFEMMKKWAKEKNCVITGSIIVKEENKASKTPSNTHYNYFNRLLWVRSDGTYESYDKRHLFRFAGEDKHYSSGTKKLIVELKGWKICPLICYDLRFPVWSRNKLIDKSQPTLGHLYDCLLYVANWPEARIAAWDTLLCARSHENQCYVVGVNRIGNDGNNIAHSGNSIVLSPKGEKLSTIKSFEENDETIVLSGQELTIFREKFPVAKDADNFSIN